MRLRWLIVTAAVFAAGCSRTATQPAPESDSANGGLIRIGADAQKHFDLRVEPVKWQELREFLKVPGTVQASDSRVAIVRPLTRGRLHDVLARVGDRVRKGQPLATYDNMEAGELAAQLASARAERERLRVEERNRARQSGRARALAGIGAIPQKELEQATTDEEALRESIRAQEGVIAGLQARLARFGVSNASPQSLPLTTIVSPLSGVVARQQASPGEVIDPASALFTVADLSTVWVQAEVYEKDLGRIRAGQQAFISVDTYPDRQFEGKAVYLSDFLDPQTRTARVRCEVPNAGLLLKLDMYANVSLPTNVNKRALAVHAGAIQEVEGKSMVFVRHSATQFEPREVTTGNRVGDLVEITQGLAAGEPVVTTGAFHLKSILVGKDLGEE